MQAVSAEERCRIAGALVEALTDKDTGVSCDAAAALHQYGSSEQGLHPVNAICLSLARPAPQYRQMLSYDTGPSFHCDM